MRLKVIHLFAGLLLTTGVVTSQESSYEKVISKAATSQHGVFIAHKAGGLPTAA